MKPTLMLKPGETLGPYKVLRPIGSGGMGEVYEALEPSIDRKVALKVINEKGLESDEMVQRFLGEARALAKLAHPNVVNLYSFGQIGKQYYMAMEFIDGMSLDDFIKKVPYGIEDTLRIFRLLLSGIGAAHAQGIIHRDLKPHNIIIDKNKNVKVIDFGIAKQMNDQDGFKTATGMFLGTLNYLAPEIAKGHQPSSQTDIYGMGIILYEMVTGRVPFSGKNSFETLEQIRNKHIEFPKRIEVLLPDTVKRLILKMTAKNLKDRYAVVQQVVEDLEKINLSDLPAELKVQSQRTRKVTNFEEIQTKLRTRHFEEPEIKMIVNLACDIQTELSFDPSKTMITDEHEEVQVSESALKEALERFSFVKNDMSVRKSVAATQIGVTGTIQRTVAASDEKTFNAVMLAGVLALVGAGVFWKAMIRPIFDAPVQEMTTQSSSSQSLTIPADARKQSEAEHQGASTTILNNSGKDFKGRALDAPLPVYNLGETFRYLENSQKTGDDPIAAKPITWMVTQVTADDVTWVSHEGTYKTTRRNPFVGVTQMINSPGGSPDYIEQKIGDVDSPFPLQIGSKATYLIKGRTLDDRNHWEYSRECAVTNYLPKDFNGGKIWTYKVECQQVSRQSDADKISLEMYYSPQFRANVSTRTIVTNKAGKVTDRTTILTEYIPPKK